MSFHTTPFTHLDDALGNSPIVISEDQAHLFNFYQFGEVMEGMRYQDELYGLVCEVSSQKQLEAYNLACALSVQSGAVIVTVSKQRYKVWVNLRSPAYTFSQTVGEMSSKVKAA